MRTTAASRKRKTSTPQGYRAETEPIEPIRNYDIPIPPFKRPPTRDDFPRIRRHYKLPEKKQDKPNLPPANEGHVDDYA